MFVISRGHLIVKVPGEGERDIWSLIFFISLNPQSVYSSWDAIESVIIFGMQFIAYCINFCYHVVLALFLTQSMILPLSEWRSQITENPSCDAHHPIIYKMLLSNNNVCSQTANNISLSDWTLTVITKYVCTGHSRVRLLLTF